MSLRRGRERAPVRAGKPNRKSGAYPPPLPAMTRGPYLVALAVAALCALAATTYAIYDADFWQHLLVGKVIWQTHQVPHTQLWTWPTHGVPDVLPSWLFRALLWPFWQWGGVHGLFLWRWLTTLAAFGLMLAAARRMGATGVAPLILLVWCTLFWRDRSQVRPETFAGVLLAAQVLLLETRRSLAGRGADTPAPPRDLAWGIVPVAFLWANAHISYYLGFIVSGGYLLDDLLHRRDGRCPGALALAMAVAAVASLANPFGWRTLVQPLDYFTVWRHEAVYRSISELAPIYWDVHVRDALPAWLALVLLGSLAHWRRRGFDGAQCVLLLVCLPQALTTQRFLGYAALTLAPFFVRDGAGWLSRRHWPSVLHAPARRSALASLASVALVVPTLAAPQAGFGYGFLHTFFPERACDWIERHGVEGKSFNAFAFGGYLLYRFYPDPDRLPFMDIHQAGTKEIRSLYARGFHDSTAWHELDHRYDFDWVLLPRMLGSGPNLADFLDADSSYSLVFADDAAALWLRREGRSGAVARAESFRFVPGGMRAMGPLGDLAARDSGVSVGLRAELERAIASSPWNERAHIVAGNLAMLEDRYGDARTHYAAAARQAPYEPELHERLGLAEYFGGDPRAALASFATERRVQTAWPAADLREGQAWAALGDRARARTAYERSLRRHPELTEAGDSLAHLR